jgi:hypothetical protein
MSNKGNEGSGGKRWYVYSPETQVDKAKRRDSSMAPNEEIIAFDNPTFTTSSSSNTGGGGSSGSSSSSASASSSNSIDMSDRKDRKPKSQFHMKRKKLEDVVVKLQLQEQQNQLYRQRHMISQMATNCLSPSHSPLSASYNPFQTKQQISQSAYIPELKYLERSVSDITSSTTPTTPPGCDTFSPNWKKQYPPTQQPSFQPATQYMHTHSSSQLHLSQKATNSPPVPWLAKESISATAGTAETTNVSSSRQIERRQTAPLVSAPNMLSTTELRYAELERKRRACQRIAIPQLLNPVPAAEEEQDSLNTQKSSSEDEKM